MPERTSSPVPLRHRRGRCLGSGTAAKMGTRRIAEDLQARPACGSPRLKFDPAFCERRFSGAEYEGGCKTDGPRVRSFKYLRARATQQLKKHGVNTIKQL